MTESALPYSHVRKQIKKRGGHKMLEAKCFYGLKKKKRKKQGFGFIAECGGEEQRGEEGASDFSAPANDEGDFSTCLTSAVQ